MALLCRIQVGEVSEKMSKVIKLKTTWTIPRDIKKPLIYFLLFYSIFSEPLISMLGFPSMMRYLNDVVVVVLFVSSLGLIVARFRRAQSMNVLAVMLAYIVSLVFGLALNGGDVLLVLWASRNTFRFFAYFIACVVFLEKEDVLRILETLYKLRWLNLILALFEYFVLGMEQDYLGGMFGVAKGCNGPLNIYLCLIMIYAVCKYLDGKGKVSSALVTILMSLVIAALAELKILYIEVIAIAFMALVLGHKKGRLWPILLAIVAGVAVGLTLLKELFPHHYEIIVNWTELLEYSTESTTGYNLGRLDAFKNINEMFFEGDVLKNLFGLGFGNCEYSSFSFLTSDFYLDYGKYNYRYLAHQVFFLESGYVGLILFAGIFVTIMFNAYKAARSGAQLRYLSRFVTIFAALTIVCLLYNAAIREEPAYLTFFVLSSVAVCMKSNGMQAERVERITVNEGKLQN